MKLKKLFIAAMLLLSFNASHALPVYYCGQYGNAFAITWFTNSAGALDFTVEYAGSCFGGPYTWGAYLMSDQEAARNGAEETPADTYAALRASNFAAVPNQAIKNDLAELDNIKSAMPGTTLYYANPDKLPFEWTKQLANNEGKSVFAVTLKDHPFNNQIKFDIWSIRDQEIVVRLINMNTGATQYQTTLTVEEGKNDREKIIFGNTLHGNYLMTITSDLNVISQVVTLQ